MNAAVQANPVLDFTIRRDDWRTGRIDRVTLPDALATGQVVLRVDRFALTANNISYALTGDMLGYWTFFPADDGWGRLPVMGFGDVLASAHPEVKPGERVFGFFPMSTHLIVAAGDAGPAHFVDVAAHRADTALAYRQYLRVAADPHYDAAREDALLLLRGLFLTSFLVDDFVADNDGFGARTVVISSASSKTAIALAFCLSRRKAAHVVGLTSARNRDFVAGLGCYDRVLAYDEVETLDAQAPSVFVDHSGDGAVVGAVHRRLADNLRHSAIVGATHWSGARTAKNLPGAAPTFFFAPSQLEKRRAEWGQAGFDARLGDAWRSFLAFSDGWLHVVRGSGPAEVERVYHDVLEGRARPDQGHILSLWEA
jgi:NADPH:quinone reductase-like Zn-dependent oxidoreductase